MQATEINKSDIIERGEAIYQTRLRAQLETPENLGKVLVIDVESGNYEIGEDHITVSNRLKHQFPASKRFAMRIGATGTYHVRGGKLL